eukprot:3995565-Prymnesium_polylepis.1
MEGCRTRTRRRRRRRRRRSYAPRGSESPNIRIRAWRRTTHRARGAAAPASPPCAPRGRETVKGV